jgi:heptose I phosphotransferase
MHLWLNDDLKSIAPEEPLDAFEWVMQLSGETVRRIEKRHTFKIVLGEKEYFIKQHYAPMWKEALTDSLSFRHPILGAENEFRVSMVFLSLGVPTAEPVGVGVCGRVWQRRSFLITESLPDTRTINEVMRSLWEQPPSYAQDARGWHQPPGSLYQPFPY